MDQAKPQRREQYNLCLQVSYIRTFTPCVYYSTGTSVGNVLLTFGTNLNTVVHALLKHIHNYSANVILASKEKALNAINFYHHHPYFTYVVNEKYSFITALSLLYLRCEILFITALSLLYLRCLYHCSICTLYTPAGLILENKHPIVAMHFLNEWGDRQVVPYHLPHNPSLRAHGRRTLCVISTHSHVKTYHYNVHSFTIFHVYVI